MSNPPVPPVQSSTILGTDWDNLITAQDHTATGPPYYCEIHLKVELGSADVHAELNRVLMAPAQTVEELQSKEAAVKQLLKAELARAGRANVSTLAIVDAIKLR